MKISPRRHGTLWVQASTEKKVEKWGRRMIVFFSSPAQKFLL
ncbi:hypothetical protein LARV_00641 [Longilinea arvoryzae]|uniref:Uncharacterized protein n=1 Tax=Longilinea arvoryzae TaxID=360412 RepID=A0A0S7BGQ1_9CHLR|nr:hypothetical protein LARV_00641 [Longilinea arvoryzae]